MWHTAKHHTNRNSGRRIGSRLALNNRFLRPVGSPCAQFFDREFGGLTRDIGIALSHCGFGGFQMQINVTPSIRGQFLSRGNNGLSDRVGLTFQCDRQSFRLRGSHIARCVRDNRSDNGFFRIGQTAGSAGVWRNRPRFSRASFAFFPFDG